MRIGFVGLGRMGSNMALNAAEHGIQVAAYNRNPEVAHGLAEKNGRIKAFDSIPSMCAALGPKKTVWLMVTAGKPVDEVLGELLPFLSRGDTVIDGGNSFYEDSVRRHARLARRGIRFLDCGTSGGLYGARHGASLTVGCDRTAYAASKPLFLALSARGGCAHVGPSGAGHFVKMVHNAIEYAMLEAYGEGFQMLAKGPYPRLDLAKISRTWNNGSVVRSWLLELTQAAFERNPRLDDIVGSVGGGETGEWAAKTARKSGLPFPSVELALRQRRKSRKGDPFYGRVIAAVRNGFGGHETVKRKPGSRG